MATLLTLYRALREIDTEDPTGDSIASLVRLADEEPGDKGLQAVAAYRSWVRGDDETALRLAVRAQEPEGTAFPALLVLVAVSSKGTDEHQTYSHAKQLVSKPRHDKTAGTIAKAIAGTGWLGPGTRREQVAFLKSTEHIHDVWVAWAVDFIQAYEASHS